MNTQIEDIDSCNKKIKFDIAYKDYEAKVKESYLALAQQVKVPGFRSGKAPMSMLEKRFGTNVKKEVMTELISEQLAEVIQEQGFRSVSPPKILEVEAEEGTDISVSASLEIVPGFKVSDYSKVVIPIEITRVTDDDVDQAINYQREHQGTKVQVTNRSVEDQDLLSIRSGGMSARPLAPLSERQQVIWETANYAVAFLGLLWLSVAWRARRKKEVPMQLLDLQDKG